MAIAGRLDKRCTFEERAEVSDGGGGFSVEWTAQFTCWGALTFASLSTQLETIQQGELTVATRGTLTVRENAPTRAIRSDWRAQVEEGGHRVATWQIGEIQRIKPGWLRMTVEAG